MARIRVDLPGKFLFETEIAVRASDLNYGGHLGNDTLLTLLQEARIQFYRKLGFASEVSFSDTVGQIIVDAVVQYKAESFLGDVLIIQLGVADITKVGFDMVYRVRNKESGREIAIAKTGIVCFDYDKRKVAAIPPILLAKLG